MYSFILIVLVFGSEGNTVYSIGDDKLMYVNKTHFLEFRNTIKINMTMFGTWSLATPSLKKKDASFDIFWNFVKMLK